MELNFIIILFSFLVSTVASVRISKNRNNRWIGMLSAFCINTLILVIATWLLYIFDDEARLFGLGQSGLGILICSIPIITWMNSCILAFAKSRKII